MTERRVCVYVGPRCVECLRVPASRVGYGFELFARESGSSFGATVQKVAIFLQKYTFLSFLTVFNPLTPNDLYMSRTAPLTSERCTLYICSTNVGTEYFKHALYSQPFSLQNAVCFIMLTSLVPALFTFYIQDVPKFKKIIPAPRVN